MIHDSNDLFDGQRREPREQARRWKLVPVDPWQDCVRALQWMATNVLGPTTPMMAPTAGREKIQMPALARAERLFGDVLKQLKRIDAVASGTAKELLGGGYMNIKQTAVYCAVSVKTIRRWVKDQGLTVTKPSGGDGNAIFKKATVDHWMADREHQAPARLDDIAQAQVAKLQQKRTRRNTL
jgi:excisionase family DNA binding protein